MSTVTTTTLPPHADGRTVVRFEGGDTFDAFNAAEAWCSVHQVSVGSMERNAPIGLKWGTGWQIAKWSNEDNKRGLDGKMTSNDFRTGPVTIDLKAKP